MAVSWPLRTVTDAVCATSPWTGNTAFRAYVPSGTAPGPQLFPSLPTAARMG